MSMNNLLVSQTNTGENCFKKISDAISFAKTIEGHVHIEIAPGIYKEKLTIDRDNMTITGLGSDPAETVLTYDDFAYDDMPDGSKRGTFRSYSVFIDANNLSIKNLTIENSSGDSKTHGQAIALYAEGDNLLVEKCRLLGHQDTLFTGPLPPKELQPGGFIGPKQFAPRINGHQHYKSCYICGDIDFIFGSASCYFENCTIDCLKRDDENSVQSYVTAASTAQGQDYGYVFESCKLISKDCPKHSCYLGRPWRNYAKTVYINCDFGDHIMPEGFHDWNKTDAHNTITYAGYNNNQSGRPFISSATFVKELSENEVSHYAKEKVLNH